MLCELMERRKGGERRSLENKILVHIHTHTTFNSVAMQKWLLLSDFTPPPPKRKNGEYGDGKGEERSEEGLL